MKPYAYLAAALLLAALLGYGAHVVRKAARVDAAEASAKAAEGRAAAAEKGRAADMAAIVKRLDDDAVQRGALLARLGEIDHRFDDIKIPAPGALVQSKEKPGEACRVPSLGPDFYRVFNASAAAGAAEAAAH